MRRDAHISDRDLALELAGEAREDRTRARLAAAEPTAHAATCECQRCTLDRDWRRDRDRRLNLDD